MFNYEEIKSKAIEIANELGLEINWAGELPQAYVFDDSENQYDGFLPMVIKKEGEPVNYWWYLNEIDASGDDIKEIKF